MKQYCCILMDCSTFLFFRILYHTVHSLMHAFTLACSLARSLTHICTHTHRHTHTHTQYRHMHSHIYSMYKHLRVKYSIYIALLCYHTLRQDSCMLLVRQVCIMASLSRKLTVLLLPFLCYTNMQ